MVHNTRHLKKQISSYFTLEQTSQQYLDTEIMDCCIERFVAMVLFGGQCLIFFRICCVLVFLFRTFRENFCVTDTRTNKKS